MPRPSLNGLRRALGSDRGLVAALVFLMGWLPGYPDHYRSQIFVGTACLVVLLARKLPVVIEAQLLFAWVLGSAVWIAFFPISHYALFGHMVEVVFRGVAARSALLIALIGAAVLRQSDCEKLEVGFVALWVYDSLQLGLPHGHGFLDNYSMDAMFVALLTPMVARRLGLWVWGVALLTVATAHHDMINARLALAVLIAGFCGPLLLRGSFKRVALTLVGGAALGFALNRHDIFTLNGRQYIWDLAHRYWQEMISPWLGSGTSTFELLGPHMQELYDHKPTTFWIWLHSDWLQLVFEQGIVGGVLGVLCLVRGLWQTRRTPWLFSSVCATAVAMTFQMPWRFVPCALYCAVVARQALTRQSPNLR